MASFNPYYNPYANPYMPQQNIQQIPQPQAQPQNNGIIWVQGEAGAKSYLVAPNTTVQLWDSEGQTIYLKSADATGMPQIKTLDYTIRDGAPKNESNEHGTFVSKSDFNKLSNEFSSLKEKVDSIARRVEEHDNDK